MEQNRNQNLAQTFCKTGCGFYGNDAFEGMCSKCFKESVERKQNSSPVTAAGRLSPVTLSTSGDTEVVNSVSATLAKAHLGSPQQETVAPTTTPSVETATPTVTVPGCSSQKIEKEAEEGAVGGTDIADDAASPDTSKDKKKKNRCHTCKKKVGLTGFQCRCGGLYCSLHRYSDKHECTFNYKEMGQEQIRKNNPVIVGKKIQKI